MKYLPPLLITLLGTHAGCAPAPMPMPGPTSGTYQSLITPGPPGNSPLAREVMLVATSASVRVTFTVGTEPCTLDFDVEPTGYKLRTDTDCEISFLSQSQRRTSFFRLNTRAGYAADTRAFSVLANNPNPMVFPSLTVAIQNVPAAPIR